MRIGPIVCELEGQGPTLENSSIVVITGPFAIFTTSRSGDSFTSCRGDGGGSVEIMAASACACEKPAMTVVAPTTALRIMNARRSIPAGGSVQLTSGAGTV